MAERWSAALEIEVIEALSHGPLHCVEVAERVGRSRWTVNRVLKALSELDFVEHDGRGNVTRWSVGIELSGDDMNKQQPKKKPCPKCNGTGLDPDIKHPRNCPRCNGTGYISG